MDTMDIVCPNYNNRDHSDELERLIVYQVSDLSFINCELDSRSQLFLVCDSPLRKIPLTHKIVFRPFSPLPNGFEYQPGRSYYLISTSNGSIEGMNNTRRGLCMSHNLRLRIDVRPVSESVVTSSAAELRSKDVNPKFIGPDGKPVRPVHKDPSNHVGLQNAPGEMSNEVNAANIDESVLFAAKHGIDLDRLEYVRQLARDGAEGDFPFVQINGEHTDNRAVAARDSTENQHDKGDSSLRAFNEGHETTNLLTGEKNSLSNRQAQRWVSSEDQRRYGGDPMTRRNGDAVSSVKELQNDADDRQDYLVDESPCKFLPNGCTMPSTKSFIGAFVLLALLTSRR
ncbi:Ephrin-4 [Toxocara canis]|uniref:Ephrin-4 n=1 Tax=Toxocara canis TaxID=6265 RepID=A0A0B2VJK0_TOXCA|nr:Ephrin-4 [Toxocara canis]